MQPGAYPYNSFLVVLEGVIYLIMYLTQIWNDPVAERQVRHLSKSHIRAVIRPDLSRGDGAGRERWKAVNSE